MLIHFTNLKMYINRVAFLFLAIELVIYISAGVLGKNLKCKYEIIQSMPDGLNLADVQSSRTVPTHVSLIQIANEARETLRIASFYWWLTAPKEFEGHPSTEPGLELMEAVQDAAARGVKVEVALDRSGRRDMNNPEDVEKLKKFARVKFLNMTQLLNGGVLHSKFMIADNKTFYVGSSNFDWRSFSQIKEIGLAMLDCPEMAQDLDKIFRTYMLMADQDALPEQLSADLKTSINMENPFELDNIKLFLAGSPPSFNNPNGKHSTGRTDDIEALLNVIERAKRRIDISVMNYSPRFDYGLTKRYWPVIDDALRRAATERRIQVRLLFSDWNNSKPLESVWYNSLNALQSEHFKGGGISVKLFRVPMFDQFQESIPFARVKHDKFMVTDEDLYIGTSNWAPSYFTTTCGVSLVVQSNIAKDPCPQPAPIVKAMQEIFERDFSSVYSHDLNC